MALSGRLVMRQGQSLVMTPQLLQAIKLLQFSSLELSAFVEAELERNPLLERADTSEAPLQSQAEDIPTAPAEADWARGELSADPGRLRESLGEGVENAFESDLPPMQSKAAEPVAEIGLSTQTWNGASSSSEGEAANLEAYVAAKIGLANHLNAQLGAAVQDPTDRLIGQMLIDAIDDAGYLSEPVEALAERLGLSPRRVERVLHVVQSLDPTGVGARNLAECLALQLRERDRYDPAMQALVAHLPLVAKRDFSSLRRLCNVDEEDLADMVAELRRLDPKPGFRFSGGTAQPVTPDVTVRAASDGSWLVELNSDALPRLLVNQTYAAKVSRMASDADRSFVSQCLQTANWLTKSLEQRAKTILKVSSEIVRQQDAFFAHGVEHLRPLNLKTIADAIGMHESTVSRVTSNKYMASPRGLFELKYFFSAAIAAHGGGAAHSAEAVRFRIKQMIEDETPGAILSDDAIVQKLKQNKIDIARRTVAKYRESLRIPSSAERRREKVALRHRSDQNALA